MYDVQRLLDRLAAALAGTSVRQIRLARCREIEREVADERGLDDLDDLPFRLDEPMPYDDERPSGQLTTRDTAP